MDKIEKIRAEIERRMLEDYNSDNEEMKYADEVAQGVCAGLLFFIDTMEAEASYDTQKYTPSPSVGIEDVARVQFASHAKVFDKKRKAVFDWEQFKEVAGIFYGFGKKDSPETKEKEQPDKSLEEAAEEWAENEAYGKSDAEFEMAYKGFIDGAKWQKQQMMKEAVEGYVTLTMTGIPTVAATIKEGDNIGVGDKVHIIVCKKEDKK